MMRKVIGLSIVTAPLYLVSPPVSAQTWNNQSLTGGMETLKFSATPTAGGAAEDAVVGLSAGPATGYASLAVTIRFAPSGVIDVRNGSNYAALAVVPYKAGVSYTFQMTLNIPVHTYSVTVQPSGGGVTTLATNYKFRSEQTTVKELSNLAIYSDKGGVTVTNAAITTPINRVVKMSPRNHG